MFLTANATDADQSDARSEKPVLQDAAVVTDKMIEEENKLQQQAELEEQRQREERDKVECFVVGSEL